MPEYKVWLVLESESDRVTEEHIITFEAADDKAAEKRFELIRIKAQ